MNAPRNQRRRIVCFVLLAVAAMALATVLDQPISRHFLGPDRLRIKDEFLRELRLAGYAPLWIAIALTIALVDRRAKVRAWWERASLLVASILISGTIAELLKLLVRRERPNASDDAHFIFRRFWDSTFSSSGIGMPSSHVAVAFGGAFMLARVAPGSWPVALAWATGCAATRVLAGAHYLSDTLAAALIAYAVAWFLWNSRRRSPLARP